MQPLAPCSHCQRHVRCDECTCPFCGSAVTHERTAPLRRVAGAKRATMVVLSVTVSSAACTDVSSEGDNVIPVYGAPFVVEPSQAMTALPAPAVGIAPATASQSPVQSTPSNPPPSPADAPPTPPPLPGNPPREVVDAGTASRGAADAGPPGVARQDPVPDAGGVDPPRRDAAALGGNNTADAAARDAAVVVDDPDAGQ